MKQKRTPVMLSDPAAISAAFEQVKDDLGPVNTLVYNAGSGSWKNVEEISPDEFELGWRINTLGALVSSQEVIPAMKNAGNRQTLFSLAPLLRFAVSR